MTDSPHRSGCPINLAVEVFGDKWSLIVLRDMMFGNRRHFREVLTQSLEGIASNILADRLKRLMDDGMISRADDPTHRQKAIYSLTEKSIALVPVFAQLGAWGRNWMPATEELSARSELLEHGGPIMWECFMSELRNIHLGAEHKGPSILEELQHAYEEAVARMRNEEEGEQTLSPPA
ncbi:MAG: helix-turn-helix transcriptional regulator [Rhizobiales bacterium]|nr:helix-turn-helix transcriptional regulator [Hyphomicrobiales bacterium]